MLCKAGRPRRISLCEGSKSHKPSVVWLCLALYFPLSRSSTVLALDPGPTEDRHYCILVYEVAHSLACQEAVGIGLC